MCRVSSNPLPCSTGWSFHPETIANCNDGACVECVPPAPTWVKLAFSELCRNQTCKSKYMLYGLPSPTL